MEFISWYHILVLHIAAILKFFVIYIQQENNLKKEGKNFVMKEYFNDRWDNWAAHYISMWLLLLILPHIVEISGEWLPTMKEIKDSPSINVLATAAVGFFGFDAVEFIIDKFKRK